MLERIPRIELWASMHSFLVQFKWFFNFKYHFEAFEEGFTRHWLEEMFSWDVAVDILGLSCGQTVGVVGVLWRKGVAEIGEKQTTVWVSVVTADESVYVVLVSELPVQL